MLNTMLHGIFVILFTFQAVQGQYGIDCPDCDIAVGGGTANSGDMFNPWAISYHLLKPNFQIDFTTGLDYTVVSANLQKACKTGYVYDYGNIASSPVAAGIVVAGNNLLPFPFYGFAVVLVYNIPELPITAPPITLTQWLIYQIFTLKITKWNDTQIQDLNPGLPLPGKKIILILRSDLAPPSKAVTKGFNRFNSTLFTNALGGYTFPRSINYTAAGSIMEASSVAASATLTTTPYSLTFLPYNWAKQTGLPTAAIFNRNGFFRSMTPPCYSDNGGVRDLSLYLGNNTNMIPDICAMLAFKVKLTYFGIKNGVECWGGNLTGHGSLSTNCNILCRGDVNKSNCGGVSSFSYFYLTRGKPVPPSTTTLQAAMTEYWNPTRGYNWTQDPLDGGGDNSYPYTLVSWLILHQVRNLECASRREFFKFLNWAYSDAKALSELSGSKGSFSPLPHDLTGVVLKQLQNLTCQGRPLLQVEFVDTEHQGRRDATIVLTTAFISFTLSIMATIVRTRNSRITKAAGLVFSCAFVLGCLFNYVSVYFWAFLPETSHICRSRILFFCIGETLILGAMFSKSWEVSKIFQRVEKGNISPFQEIPWWKFCRVFFIIFFTQMLLLIVLMGVDPPQSIIVLVDSINLIGNHECDVKYPSLWFGLQGSFFGFLMLWGALLAYQTRQVWTRYNYPNESKSILWSIYNLGLSAIVVSPWLTLLVPTEDTLFLIVGFAIIYPTTFSISMVYLPKFLSYLGSKTSKHSKGSRGKQSSGHGNNREGSVVSIGRYTEKGSQYEKGSQHEKNPPESKNEKIKPDCDSSPVKQTPTIPEEGSQVNLLATDTDMPELATPRGQEIPSPSMPSVTHGSGNWRVLVNPMATDEYTHISVFDSPEAAAKSTLLK